jgi:transglutaminase-like putative cysteine protease
MTRLFIHHTSTYPYLAPVQLWPHRLRLTPRARPGWVIEATEITCSPEATLTHTIDMAGNIETRADFHGGVTSQLRITNRLQIKRNALMYPLFPIALSAQLFAFDYDVLEKHHLAPYLSSAPIAQRLDAWLEPFRTMERVDTLTLLRSISRRIQSDIAYKVRYEVGVYDAQTTLEMASGTCRDVATLFTAAVRALGFAARLTTGYLIDGEENLIGTNDQGALHAWSEVYVPGAGWIAFDPTNDLLGDYFLIPLSSGIELAETTPIEGAYGSDTVAGAIPDVQIRIDSA